MSFEIKFTPPGQADYDRLPDDLRGIVGRQLVVLSTDPTGLSRRSVFPYAPTGQNYEFDVEEGGLEFSHFVIRFLYGQDETSLIVFGIGRTKLRREDPNAPWSPDDPITP